MLGGELRELDALRHTPAGVPLISFSVEHRSTRPEAGIDRRVDCRVQALALGETALRLDGRRAGDRVRISGFLAQRSRASAQLVVHVDQIEFI